MNRVPVIYQHREDDTSVKIWVEVLHSRVELWAQRGDMDHRVLTIQDGVIVVETAEPEVLETLGFKLGLEAESGLHLPMIEDDEETALLEWSKRVR